MSEITATPPAERPAYRDILVSGIWTNNITYVQLLGLCPLMAVTTTATNGFGMGIITTAVLVGANLLVSLLRHLTPHQIRIPVYILIISSLVTVLDLLMNAWMHDLHKILGLFIPLIVANCALLGRAESFAAHNPPFAATLDGMATGLGFTLGVTSMGAIREIIGSGTLFSGADLLLGPQFHFLEMHLLPDYDGFLLMLLPPGGFVVMGFVLAGIRGVRVWRYGTDVLKKDGGASPGCGAGCGGCHG
ncbi:electron transport complex subunit RsxE [Brenneria roseae subsp. roseae]|uniref:electron transport complex subunit E n=1 Tax=Brenneria roseae TaxID=1509241 RepID=UPI000D6229F0|nr:electron transport complex subunit E [Brenneria roseae]PWC22471.1 electron transport complex subunit RsxE [Brenneria roseae subsp. roseae]